MFSFFIKMKLVHKMIKILLKIYSTWIFLSIICRKCFINFVIGTLLISEYCVNNLCTYVLYTIYNNLYSCDINILVKVSIRLGRSKWLTCMAQHAIYHWLTMWWNLKESSKHCNYFRGQYSLKAWKRQHARPHSTWLTSLQRI